MRPGSGAARLHAGNAQRMLLAAMPKSAAAEISSARPTLLRASASAATLRRPASATPAVPLPSYTPEELNVLRLKAGRARRSSGVGVGVLPARASAVSGESPDISATRPPSAAVTPPSRSRDPPSRPTRKLSRPASPANVEQCASSLGAAHGTTTTRGRRRGRRDPSPREHRRYVIISRQKHSQAAHTRVRGLRRPRAGAARAQRAGVGSIARRVSARGRALVRLSPACIMHAARARPAGRGWGRRCSRARPRRRTAPL